MAIRPGISPSASRSSLRPHSASPRSATLYGSRPAAFAASKACVFSLRTVAIRSLLSTQPHGCVEPGSLFLCHGREQRGPARVRIRRQRPDANGCEAGAGQEARDLLLREPEPHVAHPLLVFLPIVG